MAPASKSKKRPFWQQLSLLNYGIVLGVQILLTILWTVGGGSPMSPEMLQMLFTIVFLPVVLTFINYGMILNYRMPPAVVRNIAGIMLSCTVISCLFQYIRWSYGASYGFIPPISTIDVISFEAAASLTACLLGIGLLFWRVSSYYQRNVGLIKPKPKKKVRRTASVGSV